MDLGVENYICEKNSRSRGVLSILKAIRCFVIIAGVMACADGERDDSGAEVQQFVAMNIDSLRIESDAMLSALASQDEESVQKQFLRMRSTYKHIESLTEYYFPAISRTINGPALDKFEEGDDKIISPSGFQVIEEMIFPHVVFDSTLEQEFRVLKSSLTRLSELNSSNTFSDVNVFEALRLEMLRMISLGLSGFDSPIALNSMLEARASLMGIHQIVKIYAHRMSKHEQEVLQVLDSRFFRATEYLAANSDFNTFDRAFFISRFCNPISESLFEFQLAIDVDNNSLVGAVALNAPTFFDTAVFRAEYFAPSYNKNHGIQNASLGRMLFFDPVLSGNNRRACSSCHQPGRAFTDGNTTSIAFDFKGNVRRNAPTMLNAAFQQNQFWDSRVSFIEDQISDVLKNPSEMHGDLDAALIRLNASPEYVSLFEKSYRTDTIESRYVLMAIASYIRSLSPLNAGFDRYMRGEYHAMSGEQVDGFNVFMGKGKCGTCHFMPLFNGTVPPMYSETESEVIGVPSQLAISNAEPDDDHGKREVVTHSIFDRMFKTPTLRNVALTAPYMHNGSYRTLEDVVDFYNRGGGAGIGLEFPNQSLPPEPLDLSDYEKHAIIAFLHALSDTTGTSSKPRRLPAMAGAMHGRTVGGEY